MTTLLDQLVLPAPYDTGELGAWTEYGKRKVSITLKEPGSLHRNLFSMCWIDVTEQKPWRGEPLWVSGQRRPPDSDLARQSFTDAARKAIAAELLPVVQRYGFHRWWCELHREKGDRAAQEGRSRAEESAKAQRWHTAHAELGELYADGVVDPVALPPTPVGERARRLAYIEYDGRWGYAEAVARLMLGEEQVGWMTSDGKLLPMWNEPW